MATPSSSYLLSAENIGLVHQQRTLLEDITMSVAPKEIVTIIGPNGAGKTSLLNILLGLRAPSSGTVTRAKTLAIGYMPQRLRLNNQLPISVERFLSYTNHCAISIEDALLRTGVAKLAKTSMHYLSGGEMQRVLLARALLRKPNLLVLDEPVQGVDVNGQNQLYGLIKELRDELQCGVLMVSHDLHIVMAATDHVICLNQHICCHGHPDTIASHPAYLEMFGHSVGANVAIYTHNHNTNGCIHQDDTEDKRSST